MRIVNLNQTDLKTTAVGYGCAQLMARIRLKESVQLLETAFDGGIRHFDVARSYGYGEAEKAVGEFIANKRDQVTVTTKFGIQPPRRSSALSAAKAVARRVVAVYPGLRERLRQKAAQMVTTGCFDSESAKQSLDASLRELKTDYVDVLLLHECTTADLEKDELLEFLEASVANGKIRAFGTATTFADTCEVVQQKSHYAPIVQIPSSALNRNLEKLPSKSDLTVFTHSVLGADFQQILSYLKSNPARVREWSDQLSLDCSNSSNVAGLMLDYAIESNSRGVVLYSSVNQQHVKDNAKALTKTNFTNEQRNCFIKLADRAKQQVA